MCARISATTASICTAVRTGTRAALVYLRRHGEHVRSMILDGVAPTDMRLPLFTARDAQRALDKLLTDCDADSAVPRRIPGLSTRVRESAAASRARHRRACASSIRAPASPRTSRVEARVVASILFERAVFTAHRVDRAGAGRSCRAATTSRASSRWPRRRRQRREHERRHAALGPLQRGRAARDACRRRPRGGRGTMFGDASARRQLEACAMWPRGTSMRRITSRSSRTCRRWCCRGISTR